MQEQALTHFEFTIDVAVSEWLLQKERHTGSVKTRRAYETTLADFRAFLHRANLDLLSNPVDIARLAPLWANLRNPRRHEQGKQLAPVASATYNQRLAILSSWYSFVQQTYHLDLPNPIKDVARRPVQAYATSRYLEAEAVEDGMDTIDRRSKVGLRDYALLAVAIFTGRRASELVGLRGCDVNISAKQRITLTFHCKGGKIQRDRLDEENSAILLDYLLAQFGTQELLPDAPLWVSYSRRNPGQGITIKTLARICERYLDTSKVHALRHTFAHGMIQIGAPITDLAGRLGHSDIRITQRYGRELTSDENPHAAKLTARFGMKRKGKRGKNG
jgi:integrase